MTWKGTVSQLSQCTIAITFTTAKRPQATSSAWSLRGNPVANVPRRLDRRVRAKLAPHTADADLDHVRARVEVIAPHLGEQALAADDFAGALAQVEQQAELAVCEVDGSVAGDPRLVARQVEQQRSSAQHPVVAVARA